MARKLPLNTITSFQELSKLFVTNFVGSQRPTIVAFDSEDHPNKVHQMLVEWGATDKDNIFKP